MLEASRSVQVSAVGVEKQRENEAAALVSTCRKWRTVDTPESGRQKGIFKV
jgi:hypothetical protein